MDSFFFTQKTIINVINQRSFVKIKRSGARKYAIIQVSLHSQILINSVPAAGFHCLLSVQGFIAYSGYRVSLLTQGTGFHCLLRVQGFIAYSEYRFSLLTKGTEFHCLLRVQGFIAYSGYRVSLLIQNSKFFTLDSRVTF